MRCYHGILSVARCLCPDAYDTSYGSSTYNNIKLNTEYTVLKSQTGLMVREIEVVDTKEKSYFERAKEFVGFQVNS